MDLATLVARLSVESAQYIRDLKTARGETKAFEKGVESSLHHIQASFARFASVAFLEEFARRTIEAGAKLEELSKHSGVSAATLSRLGYAAEQSGLTVDTLASALDKAAKFSVALEQGGKKQTATLNALGITTDKYLSLDLDGQLLEIAKSFETHADGAGKAAASMVIYGKAGAALIPMLDRGAEGIAELTQESDDLGHTVSDSTAASFKEFEDDIHRVRELLTGGFRAALVEVVDPLDEVLKLAIDAGEGLAPLAPVLDLIGVAAKSAATGILFLATGLEVVGDVAGGFTRTIWESLFGDTSDPTALADTIDASVARLVGHLEQASQRLDHIWDAAKNRDVRVSDSTIGMFFEQDKPGIHFGGDGSGKDKKRGAKAPADKTGDRIAADIEALQKQAATLGMTSEQEKLYELSTLGATDAQMQAATAAVDSIQAYDRQQDSLKDTAERWKELQSLYDQYQPEIEGLTHDQVAYNKSLADLRTLVDAKLISPDEMKGAAQRIKDQIDGYKQVADFWEENGDRLESATSNLFVGMITDAEHWKDHLIGFMEQIANSFAKMVGDMAAQAIAKGIGNLIGGILGTGAGAGLGGSGGTLGNSPGGFINYGSWDTTGLHVGANADGGLIPAGGWSIVGERGPELVQSTAVSRVFNHEDSLDMLGGRRTVVNQNWNFYTPGADSFVASRRQIQRKERAMLGAL